MQIGGGGSTDINLLQSDAVTARNADVISVAGNAYHGGTGTTSTAAQYSQAQLLNTAASGRVVRIDDFYVNANVTMAVYVGYYSGALATSIGRGLSVNESAGDSQAFVRRTTGVALLGDYLAAVQVQAGIIWHVPLRYPIQLSEGVSFMIQASVVNQAFNVWFNWREYVL